MWKVFVWYKSPWVHVIKDINPECFQMYGVPLRPDVYMLLLSRSDGVEAIFSTGGMKKKVQRGRKQSLVFVVRKYLIELGD